MTAALQAAYAHCVEKLCTDILFSGHLAEEDPSKPDVRTAVVRKVRGADGHVTMQVCPYTAALISFP